MIRGVRTAGALILSLWLAWPSAAAIPYALKFGTATSDRVVLPTTATVLDNLDPVTIIVRGRVDTFSAGRVMYAKGTTGANTRRPQFNLNSTAPTGNILVSVDRATSDLAYTSSSSPLSVVGQPFTLAIAVNSAGGAGLLAKGYVSVAGNPFTTITWGTATDGSGAFNSDAGIAAVFGNVNPAAPSNALQGVLWEGHILAADLSLGDLQATQLRKSTRLGSTRWLGTFAANGTGRVIDRSGYNNHATITGAIPTNDVLPRVGFRGPP